MLVCGEVSLLEFVIFSNFAYRRVIRTSAVFMLDEKMSAQVGCVNHSSYLCIVEQMMLPIFMFPTNQVCLEMYLIQMSGPKHQLQVSLFTLTWLMCILILIHIDKSIYPKKMDSACQVQNLPQKLESACSRYSTGVPFIDVILQ